MNLQYIIVGVLYLILSTDAINCKGCVPLDIFTFDKVCPTGICVLALISLRKTAVVVVVVIDDYDIIIIIIIIII
jgi:hypothetical protein